jgi:outer membrane protein assembly factor BamD (BamD/ComL family)
VRFFRRTILIFSALILCSGNLFAASREERLFTAASTDFQTELWSRAETEFAQFIQRYPKSTNAPMAVLLQAQAQFNQQRFADTIATLAHPPVSAGGLADQFALWTGEAQFAAGNFPAAADTFAKLAKNFADSPLRLRAAVAAASALEKLRDWQQLSALLGDTNGVFARTAQLDAANELVARGRLLLAQAQFEQKDFTGAAAQLAQISSPALKPELDWQRMYLLARVKLAAGEPDAAFAAATNLPAIALAEKNETHRAEGAALRAEILARTGHNDEAAAVWQENLAASAPPEKQRQAVLQIASLAATTGNYAEADARLDYFLKQFPNSPATDLALLTRGELLLKNYSATTNPDSLALAHAQFDALSKTFPASEFDGRALLGRGWSESLPTNPAAGLEDFRAAAQKNLSPEELAVARFKTGDALFAQKDFRGARENYSAVATADKNLNNLALYQSLRCELELTNVTAAGDLFAQLAQSYSGGELEQGSALLYGESLVRPADARALFEKLAPTFAGAPLEPQLQLARAQTFEQEADWAAAVTNYEGWLQQYPTNELRPQADYALAQAVFHAGDEARALKLFTEFVAQHPADTNAPLAQFWIGDHFFRAENFVAAETNYEAVFQNPAWKNSPLFYPAQLMAGRAAMGRTDFKDASVYFTALIVDTNCSAELRDRARFAAGAALMHMDSSDTNSTFANLQSATNLFAQIIAENPTNDFTLRALGETADCDVLLGDFVSATNAYAQIFGTNSNAGVSARSRAQTGFGQALEKMASQNTNVDQANLQTALDAYLDVFDQKNLRDGETADLFWVKEAGLKAAPLVGKLLDAHTQKKFYAALEQKLPQLASAIEKKIVALPAD